MATFWNIVGVRAADIDASHAWAMPGVSCPACGRSWTTVGPALPSISLVDHPLANRFRPTNVAWEEWRELQNAIRDRVPSAEPIVPGLQLGPLRGKVTRPFRLGFFASWGLVVAESLRRELLALAPDLTLVQSDMTDRTSTTYYEFELYSLGAVAHEEHDHCQVCGYSRAVLPPDPLVLRDDPQASIFRVRALPTVLLAHERLLPLLRRELGDAARYEPVQLPS